MSWRRKIVNRVVYSKYGLFICAIIIAFLFFYIGRWHASQNTVAPSRIPAATPEEKRLMEAGKLLNDGVYFVNSEIQPGVYRTTGNDVSAVIGCNWQRLSGFTAGANNIIVDFSDYGAGWPAIVRIDAQDQGFKTDGCGKWYFEDVDVTQNLTQFKDGAFIVGRDIQPGTYRARAKYGCQWERLGGFTRDFYKDRLFGGDSELLAKSSATVATILETDKGFLSKGCLEWTLVD